MLEGVYGGTFWCGMESGQLGYWSVMLLLEYGGRETTQAMYV